MSVISNIWSNITKAPSKQHAFSDTDRLLSAESRRIKAKIKQAERHLELSELEETLNKLEEERNPTPTGESMEDKLLMQVLQNVQTQQSKEQPEAKRGNLSDEEIQKVIKTIPKEHIKMAKSMPRDLVIQKIMELAPIDTDTAARLYSAIL